MVFQSREQCQFGFFAGYPVASGRGPDGPAQRAVRLAGPQHS